MASKRRESKQDSIGVGRSKEVRTEKRSRNGDVPKNVLETRVRERKSHLQKEYTILTEHMCTYMGRVQHLLQENKVLEEEAKRNCTESNIYLSYWKETLHSRKGQNLIITLNDWNETDLSQVQKQKEKLISQYAEKEKELRNCLVKMGAECSLLNREVEALQPFKDLQSEQMRKIKELEKKLLVTKIHHSTEKHKIKSSFLQAKAAHEEDSQQKILLFTKSVEAAAMKSLIQYITHNKAENWHLRQELLSLIQCSKVLKEIMVELHKQQQQLLWAEQYTQDMAHTRHSLHQQSRTPAALTALSHVDINLKKHSSAPHK